MHIEYINKTVVLDNIINEINLINIEDNIEYLHRNDGILIRGKIDIDCEYISLGVIKNFKDNVDISLLVPFENIISNEIFFKLVDFDYYIKNNNLSLSFKANIEGYKEVEKTFQNDEEEVEVLSDYNVDINALNEIINNDQEIIELNEEDLINNKILLLDSENIEDSVVQSEKEQESIIIIDNHIDSEGDRLEFNILGDEIKEENNKSFFSSLFKKEKKEKIYKYRVVLENDTYEEIAKEYNINLYKLKNLNNDSILVTGQMIKIPSKNE